VFGRRCFLSRKLDDALLTRSSTEPDCRKKSASLDDGLITSCRHFRVKLHEWIEQVAKSGIESYAENEEFGRPLHALRVEWGTSLKTLSRLEPRTLDGADEKLNAARFYLEFSGDADGSAIALVALATRQLDHVSDGNRSSDRAQLSRRANAQGRFWWLGRLTRRA
jgi:hypothetical protein